MHPISIATCFLRNDSPIEALERLHRAGFRYISADFWQYSAPNQMLAQDNWRELIAKYKEAADRLGLVFNQTHGNTLSGKQWDDPDFAERANLAWMLNHRALEASKTLGAKWVVMHPYNYPRDPLYSKKRAFDGNLAYLAPFIESAKKLNIGIALENMVDFGGNRRRYCGGDPDELLELVDVINDPAVGICIDTGHANLSGIDSGAFIRMAGSRLKCTHINDNSRDGDKHLPPYFGTVDWKDVVAALREINYTGDYSLELSAQHFPAHTLDTWCRFAYDLSVDMLK